MLKHADLPGNHFYVARGTRSMVKSEKGDFLPWLYRADHIDKALNAFNFHKSTSMANYLRPLPCFHVRKYTP